MMAQFISEYGTLILYSIITAVFGYLGLLAKNLCDKYLKDKTKREIAKSCVQFAEQVYHNCGGEEKLEKALEAASEMLAEKGITCSELELRVLIESAVASFNDAFNKGKDELPETEYVDDFKGDYIEEATEPPEETENEETEETTE